MKDKIDKDRLIKDLEKENQQLKEYNMKIGRKLTIIANILQI